MSTTTLDAPAEQEWPEGLLYRSPIGLFGFQEQGIARAYLELEQHDGVMAVWDTGCIYGDAEITVNRGGNSSRMALSHVVKMFNGGRASNGHQWDLNVPTMVQREVDGIVRLVPLRGAWESGKKFTYTVTTHTGRTIRATNEHPFLTTEGWKRLDELRPGTQVHVRGDQRSGRVRKVKAQYKMVSWLVHHPYATTRQAKKSPHRVPQHRLVVEAHMNGLEYDEYIKMLRRPRTQSLSFLHPKIWAVHHIDHDHRNNDLANLKVMTHEEHHRLHAVEGKTESVLYKTTTEVVLSVEPYGEEETYDLSVPDDPHNFIADGFVVHNTGKSHLAMALSALMIEDGLIDIVLLVAERTKIAKDEWPADLARFTRLRTHVWHGTGREKRLEKHLASQGMPQVIVTTYETGKADLLKPVPKPGARRGTVQYAEGPLMPLVRGKRVLLVMDESAKVKNRNSGLGKAWNKTVTECRKRTTKMAKAMPGSNVRALMMTATPIERDWEDAYNQMRLADPKRMPKIGEFEAWFTRGQDPWGRTQYKTAEMPKFAAMAAPMILRVRKTDPEVIAEFPKQVEEARWFDMAPDQRSLYEMICDLEDPEDPEPVFGLYTVKRMVANHPASLIHSAKHGTSKIARMLVEELGEDYLRAISSVKQQGLLDYLEPVVLGQGAKAVVFSYFGPSVLPLLASSLRGKKMKVFMAHGGMTTDEVASQRGSFKTHDGPAVFLSSDAGAKGVNLPQATYVCVEASTPVLTPDLRWVPAGSLAAGDGVVGCEENAREGKRRERSRRWRVGSVVRNQVEPRRCLKVTLSNGESLVVTPEHRMIVRSGKGVRDWVRAEDLKVGWRVLKYLDTWGPRIDFDDGWLSGIFDGEGWFIKSGRSTTLAVAQNEGHVLDKVRSIVLDAGFAVREYHHEKHGKIHRFHVVGGRAEQTRFLGEYQPVRLVPKWRGVIEECIISAIDDPKIVSIEDAGVRDVAVMETTMKTFIGAGYMHHNCEFESALTFANRTQRINRAHRIDSTAASVTCMTFFARHTVEQSIAENMIERNQQTDILLADDDLGEDFISALERRRLLQIRKGAGRRVNR